MFRLLFVLALHLVAPPVSALEPRDEVMQLTIHITAAGELLGTPVIGTLVGRPGSIEIDDEELPLRIGFEVDRLVDDAKGGRAADVSMSIHERRNEEWVTIGEPRLRLRIDGSLATLQVPSAGGHLLDLGISVTPAP